MGITNASANMTVVMNGNCPLTDRPAGIANQTGCIAETNDRTGLGLAMNDINVVRMVSVYRETLT